MLERILDVLGVVAVWLASLIMFAIVLTITVKLEESIHEYESQHAQHDGP